MINLNTIQKAIPEENLEGWLFYIFQHRDSLACDMLDIPASLTNTRPWIYFIPATGEAIKITHSIEACGLDHLPGQKRLYSSRNELENLLGKLAKHKNIAVQISDTLQAISLLDHSTALLLEKAGFILHSSASLIQRTFSLLDRKGYASHLRACEVLLDIIAKAWAAISTAFKEGRPVYEGEIQKLMLTELAENNLETNHPPVVAAGISSSSPHYCPEGRGRLIAKNEVVQFDIWAREKTKDSVYADISWLGFTADTIEEVPQGAAEMFNAVCLARDSAVAFIAEALQNRTDLCGSEADLHVRQLLDDMGYGKLLRHRTGHSIDRNVHGSGVNLDSTEFPDTRLFLDGSCFSIEPGIYDTNYGMRTEIDVYIKDRQVKVSGSLVQKELLLLPCKQPGGSDEYENRRTGS